MDVLDAAFHTVHNRVHGGAQGLAPRMNKTHQALSSETRGAPGFKFGLLDSVTVQLLTGDTRILMAMAAQLGFGCFPLPTSAGDDSPCASKIATLAMEFSGLMSELAEDLKDNKITDTERSRIEQKSAELIAAVQGVIRHVQSLNALLHVERAA